MDLGQIPFDLSEDFCKAEEETLNRSLHQPMKSWFNGLTSSKFKEKYGPFPSFWQDMSTYAHLKIIRKLYLKTSDMGKGEYDIDEIEIKVLATQAETADSRPPVADHNDLAPESESTSGRSGGEAEAAGTNLKLGEIPAARASSSALVSLM